MTQCLAYDVTGETKHCVDAGTGVCIFCMKNPERDAVEALKANWFNDPCWDIETTEGFEEHKQELYIFRLESELTWERKSYSKLQRELEKKCNVIANIMVAIGKDLKDLTGL